VLVLVTTVDFCTKALAVNRLTLEHMPHDLFGDWMRFTLVYNPGAAFGLHVGEHSRWIFMVLTMIALVILGRLYQTTRGRSRETETSRPSTTSPVGRTSRTRCHSG